MRKNKVIQFILITIGITLFIFTYYFSKEKDKVVNIDKNTSDKEVSNLTAGMSNVIEKVNYVGTDNKGSFFELNAAFTEIFDDEPDVSHLKMVDAIISARNGKNIHS